MPRLFIFPGLSLLLVSMPLWAIASLDAPRPLAVSESTLALQTDSLEPAHKNQVTQVAVLWE